MECVEYNKYNLTFLEAVKALSEGKAKTIENTAGCRYEIRNAILSYVFKEIEIVGINLPPQSFLGKWRLVGLRPVKWKEILSEVTWHRNREVIYPTAWPNSNWSKFLEKPPMKMTLEWEE